MSKLKLSMCHVGAMVEVLAIELDQEHCSTLQCFGISNNSHILISQHIVGGGLILISGRSRVAISASVAENMTVQLI